MSVLLVALGGGRGHAVRARELARALGALGQRVRVVEREGALPAEPTQEIVSLPLPGSRAELRARLEREMEEMECQHVVVDALPAGVLGELDPLWPGPHITLLARLHRAQESAEYRRGLAAYDLVVDLEPELSELGAAATAFGAVARRFALGPEPLQPDVLVIASEPAQRGLLLKLARRTGQRGLDVWVSDGSAVGRLGEEPSAVGALDFGRICPRVVVGPAGYNLTYELAAAGIHHLALPAPRRFDDQARRARQVAELASGPEALEARVEELAGSSVPRQPMTEVKAHAELAARLVEAWSTGSRRSAAPS